MLQIVLCRVGEHDGPLGSVDITPAARVPAADRKDRRRDADAFKFVVNRSPVRIGMPASADLGAGAGNGIAGSAISVCSAGRVR